MASISSYLLASTGVARWACVTVGPTPDSFAKGFPTLHSMSLDLQSAQNSGPYTPHCPLKGRYFGHFGAISLHLSYRHYCGYQCHIEAAHRILYRDYLLAPATALM